MRGQADLRPLELRNVVSKLRDKKCWSIVAGSGTGSIITMNFGEKVPLKRWLGNETLDPETRRFEGEYALYIECAWRIRSSEGVICSWTSDNSPGGEMLFGLGRLEGTTVTAVDLRDGSYDLRLEFNDGLILDVFCDQLDPEEGIDNYSFFTREAVLTVGPGSRLHRALRVSV